MKRCLVLIAVIVAFSCVGIAQAAPCAATPTPGTPHVCVSWTAPTTPPAVTGYNIYRATTTGAENFATPLNSSLITSPYFYDTTDVVGTEYFYKVIAVGTGGVLGTPSSEVSAQIPLPPSSPTAPAATID
jgi:hypothetical protein